MATDEARLPIIHSHAMPLLRDVWRFALYPRMADAKLTLGRDFAIALIVLFLLDLSLAGLSEGILWGAEYFGYEPPDEIEYDDSLAMEWFMLVVLAPLIEEPLFRGFLSGHRNALILLSRVAAGVALMGVGVLASEGEFSRTLALVLASLGVVVVLAAAVDWFRKRHLDTAIVTWFPNLFPWLVWASVLAFSLVHMFNFEGPLSPVDSIMVMSQTAGGVVLAYTRTRLGLPAAIAQHAAFNAVIGLTGF